MGSSVHIWTINNLLVTWFRIVKGAPSRWPDPRELIDSAELAGLIVRIWPPQVRNLTWPPKLSFDITTYNRWSYRFGYFT
jgi:hypothetical protein